MLNTLIQSPKTIYLKFSSSHLRPPLKTTWLNHRFRGGILTICPHTPEGGVNSITGATRSVWTDTNRGPCVALQGKTPLVSQCHYGSCQTFSYCHFGSGRGANSICDEVSGVPGWVGSRYSGFVWPKAGICSVQTLATGWNSRSHRLAPTKVVQRQTNHWAVSSF